jgi:pimeloyl-ACP methyl ester carboxylesterase
MMVLLPLPSVLRAQDTLPPPLAHPRPPGRLVDVGGYRLHLYCTGSGSPTVVVIDGFGDFSFDWALVQPGVASSTRVCSYDRAGQAWSDVGPEPRGLARITDELHALLQRSGEKGPFVLVGQSWGGLIPRLYVAKYRPEVAGVVFVDASVEDMWMWLNGVTFQPRLAPDSLWNRIWPRRRPNWQPPPNPARPTDTAYVTADTTTPKLDPPFNRLPIQAQRYQKWAQRLPPAALVGGDWSDIREDFRAVHRVEAGTAHPFGTIPVIVLSAGKDDFEDAPEASAAVQRAEFDRGHRALAQLSTNARRIIALSSGHRIQFDEPDLVIEAIRQVLESSRAGSRLCCQDQ